MRDFRNDIGALQRVLVPAGEGRQVPLSQLAEVKVASGPAMIRDEDGLLTGYVYVDIAGRDIRRLYPGRRPGPPGEGEAAARVRRHLERAVRGHGAGQPDGWPSSFRLRSS